MIEPTDEMAEAVANTDGVAHMHPELAWRVAAAVLAIVERDYDLRLRGRCLETTRRMVGGGTVQCEKLAGHEGAHQGESTFWSGRLP